MCLTLRAPTQVPPRVLGLADAEPPEAEDCVTVQGQPSPWTRATEPPQRPGALGKLMGRASRRCLQAKGPALRPDHRPKPRFLIWGPPLFLPPSEEEKKGISPCWGELESQPGGMAKAIGPPHPTLSPSPGANSSRGTQTTSIWKGVPLSAVGA